MCPTAGPIRGGLMAAVSWLPEVLKTFCFGLRRFSLKQKQVTVLQGASTSSGFLLLIFSPNLRSLHLSHVHLFFPAALCLVFGSRGFLQGLPSQVHFPFSSVDVLDHFGSACFCSLFFCCISFMFKLKPVVRFYYQARKHDFICSSWTVFSREDICLCDAWWSSGVWQVRLAANQLYLCH